MNLKDVKTYPAAHVGALLIVLAFAIVSTLGAVAFMYGSGLPQVAKLPAAIVAGLVASSVAFMPVVVAPAWANAKGFTKVTGLVIAMTFCMFDGAFQTNAVVALDKMTRADAIASAQTRVDDAQKALDAVADPAATGDGIRNRDTWNDVMATRRDILRDAEAKLAKAEATSLPVMWIALAFAMFQASTFFCRAWLTTVTEHQKQAIREARLTPKKRKSPARKAGAKPKASKPTLVASNDA